MSLHSKSSPVTLTILCLCWYLSSALTNTIAKQIFSIFKYPITLTLVQFIIVAAYCLLYSILTNSISGIFGYRLGSRAFVSGSLGNLTSSGFGGGHSTTVSIRRPTRQILTTIFPLALFLIAGHIFSSVAISKSSVAFVHTVKALSPLFTVIIYKIWYNHSYHPQIYLSLLPLTIGVMLACSFDLSSSDSLGFICAMGSTIIFVCQNIFSKRLLKERKAGLDRLNTLFYSSAVAGFLMFPLWFYSEFSLFSDTETVAIGADTATSSDSSNVGQILFLLFLNGSSFFVQNVLAFYILSLISPVTYSIASLIKRIVVIVLSIIWFGESVGLRQAVGVALTGVGLWFYHSVKHRHKSTGGSIEDLGHGLKAKQSELIFNLNNSHSHNSMHVMKESSSISSSVDSVLLDMKASGGDSDSLTTNPNSDYEEVVISVFETSAASGINR